MQADTCAHVHGPTVPAGGTVSCNTCYVCVLLQVGWVCTNYHNLYRRPRGMFFSSYDKDHMAAMVYNW
jgi:hypothetical protein